MKDQWGNRHYVLQAVSDKANESWSKATPSGDLKFSVSNPDAESLVPGKSYFIDISLAPEPSN